MKKEKIENNIDEIQKKNDSRKYKNNRWIKKIMNVQKNPNVSLVY